MSPIALLMEEHRRIERVLAALFAFGTGAAKAAPEARKDVAGFAAFFKDYADRVHHGKEEDILFAAMERNGMPREMGPLAVMYAEHREGRAQTAALATIGAGAGPLTAAEQDRVERVARLYVPLLRDHIQKEDLVLYPMADQVLDGDAWTEVESAFAAFAALPATAATTREMQRVGEDLVRRHGSVSVGA